MQVLKDEDFIPEDVKARQALKAMAEEATAPIYAMLFETLEDGRLGIGIKYKNGRVLPVVIEQPSTVGRCMEQIKKEWITQ